MLPVPFQAGRQVLQLFMLKSGWKPACICSASHFPSVRHVGEGGRGGEGSTPVTDRKRTAPFSVCLGFVWAPLGQEEPFHPQLGAVFDQNVPASDSHEPHHVGAAVGSGMVPFSPHRPPLA